MPNPKNYKNKEGWMRACVPMIKKEGKGQDQAVAQCLNMWKTKDREDIMEINDAQKSSFKLQINSDGTLEGTKVKLNGEDITSTKYITDVRFGADGGIIWDDGSEPRDRIDFFYREKKQNGDGSIEGISYSYTNGPDGISPLKRSTLGKAKEVVNDRLVGRESEVISKIEDYRSKTKRYIPTKDELLVRTQSSLEDLLKDLESENGK